MAYLFILYAGCIYPLNLDFIGMKMIVSIYKISNSSMLMAGREKSRL